jgi:hypothetical protein
MACSSAYLFCIWSYITFKKLTSEFFLLVDFLYAIYGHSSDSQIHSEQKKSSSLLAVIVSGAIKDPPSRWKEQFTLN